MADSKITALTAISTVDPTADPLVIVDVSDTSMAASGTTKKSTINQLLGAGGTATLASATITGDLTVDTSTLKVDSTNNWVGINNATPGVALQIGTTSGTNKFCINTAVTNAGDIQMRRNSFIGFSSASDNANSEYLFANAGVLEFGIGGSAAMTLNTTSNLVLKGGTAAANGVGVTFPAVQVASSDANCLDDYEEGTFTPGITFGGASVALTGTFNGRYTKVGRTVTVSGIIVLSAKGSSTGTALITGLPFTSSGGAGSYFAASLRLSLISFTDTFQGWIGPSGTVINLEQVTNAGADTVLTNTNFPVGVSVLIWNATYDV